MYRVHLEVSEIETNMSPDTQVNDMCMESYASIGAKLREGHKFGQTALLCQRQPNISIYISVFI